MPPLPTHIKLALSAWLLAATLETGIVIALTQHQLIPLLGTAPLLLLVCMHMLLVLQCSRRRKWAYGAMLLLAPLSLLWIPYGRPFLARLNTSAILIVMTFIALRFGALALTRMQTSTTWIESHTIGATFWLTREPNITLGRREKLMQLLAVILLGPALIAYMTGWNRTLSIVGMVAGILLVVLSLILAAKRTP